MNVLSMWFKNRSRVTATVAALFILAGCGNSTDGAQGYKAFKAAYQGWSEERKSGPPTAETAVSAQQAAARAASKVPGPVMIVMVVNTKKAGVIAPYGENGRYRTWRTPINETITFKDGVLTSTRGLGYDLMSSNADESIALIRARRSGQAKRIYRHLSGENHEVPTDMTCDITVNGAENVTIATGAQTSATKIKEKCRSEAGKKVTNTYWVTGAGNIVQSKQWVSPIYGSLIFQTVRN